MQIKEKCKKVKEGKREKVRIWGRGREFRGEKRRRVGKAKREKSIQGRKEKRMGGNGRRRRRVKNGEGEKEGKR